MILSHVQMLGEREHIVCVCVSLRRKREEFLSVMFLPVMRSLCSTPSEAGLLKLRMREWLSVYDYIFPIVWGVYFCLLSQRREEFLPIFLKKGASEPFAEY